MHNFIDDLKPSHYNFQSNDKNTSKPPNTGRRSDSQKDSLITQTVQIVSSYLSQNQIDYAEIPKIIRQVHGALIDLSVINEIDSPPKFSHPPAVPIDESIQDDYLICLEDGKRLKMLKRHLKTAYNMTPDDYRKKWNLPADYPMVAPNYAQRRSKLAKDIGLGTKPR